MDRRLRLFDPTLIGYVGEHLVTDPRCRSGKHCVRLTTDGPGITSLPGALCHGCVTAIQKCLDELPHLSAALSTLKGSWGAVSYEARVGGSKEPPIPLDVGVVDLIDEIADVIDRTGGYAVRDLVFQPTEKWIIWRHGKRSEVELDGVSRALDIRRVHVKAEARVGFQKVWSRRAAACPECLLPSLGSWVGDENISCTNGECLTVFTRDEYESACRAQSRNERNVKGK